MRTNFPAIITLGDFFVKLKIFIFPEHLGQHRLLIVTFYPTLPRTPEELLDIVGAGEITLRKYGHAYLKLLNEILSL
jgi:hypothetical protein